MPKEEKRSQKLCPTCKQPLPQLAEGEVEQLILEAGQRTIIIKGR